MSHSHRVCLRRSALALAAAFLLGAGLPAAEAGINPQLQPLYILDFEGADALSGWDNAKYASLDAGRTGGQALKVTVPAGEGKAEDFSKPGSNILRLKLDPAKVAGKRIFVRGWIKAENVSKPSIGWLGIKLTFHYRTASGEIFKHPNDLFGTFDWTKQFCNAGEVPADATDVCLYLGLQDCTGQVWFDDLRVYAFAPETEPEIPAAAAPFRGHDLPRLRGLEVNKYNPDNEPTDPATPDDKKHWNARVIGRDWNANLIRYQVLWPEVSYKPKRDDNPCYDLAAYDAWLEAELLRVDKLLEACAAQQVYVVFNLFTWPGADRFFKEKKYQEHLVEVWRKLAAKYRNHPMILGYDLLNEPHEEGLDFESAEVLDWQHLAAVVAKAIREIDPQTPIIVETPAWDGPSGFIGFKPIPVDRVIYSVHMYEPGRITHQGVVSVIGEKFKDERYAYPGDVKGEKWDKDRLRKALEPVRQFQLKYNVHMYVGEFSCIRWAPDQSSYRYLKDVIDLFEEYGWDWSYHAFREWQGWSTEYDEDITHTAPATEPTTREKLLRDWFAQNQKPAFAAK